MKRKLLSVILIPILVLVFAFSVQAEDKAFVIDNAHLLSEDEQIQLNDYAKELSESVEMDLVILTVDSLEGKTAEEYADDYFDYNGYGQGPDNSGVLFLIDMGSRTWAISTTGQAIGIFSDKAQENLMNGVRPFLSDGEFSDAFAVFLNGCCDQIIGAGGGFINEAEFPEGEIGIFDDEISGQSDVIHIGSSSHENDGFVFGRVVISILFGFLIACLIVAAWKKKLQNVEFKSGASDYLSPGSFNLTVQKDIYLYRNVVRTPKPKENSGSSTHMGSSGTSHGGSSGHF